MKPTLLAKIAAGSVMALSTTLFMIPDALANRYNYWIANRSSSDITEFYISESWRRDWGPDVTGAGVIRSGGSVQITFANPSPNECSYDLLAVFETGEVLTRRGVNVCSTGSYGEFAYYD